MDINTSSSLDKLSAFEVNDQQNDPHLRVVKPFMAFLMILEI